MTRRTIRAAAVLVNIFLAACGGAEHAAKTFRVALITPGPVSDQAWNGRAYEGLQRIKDSLGAQVSHIETATPAQFEENFRAYGAQGFDLVFGHGSEFQDAALKVAPEFPKTIYVTTGGNKAVNNAIGIEFAFEEGSYIAGMVAATITHTKTIGCIGGTELPPVTRSFAAFKLGVRAIDSTIHVLTSYVGNWDDASAGKEQALAQIGRGADVIFGNADAAGLGIFQAARETNTVRVIGANADQAHLAPQAVIGSVVIDIPHAFLTVAREVQSNTFSSRVVSFGTKSDVVRWVYNPATETTIPADARERIDRVAADLRSGAFKLPSVLQAP